MAITLIPPPASPGSPAAALQAGGSLTNGQTYYFKIVASTYNVYSCTQTYYLRSGPTAEVSATADAVNKTIRVSWNAVPGAPYYWVYVRWGASQWYKVVSGNACTTTGLYYDFAAESDKTTSIFDFFAMVNNTMPSGLSTAVGVGCCNIDGGSNTLKTIFDTIIASYPNSAKYDDTNYVTTFHLNFIGTGSTTIDWGTRLVTYGCSMTSVATYALTWQGGSEYCPTAWSHRAFSNCLNMTFTEFVYVNQWGGSEYEPVFLGADLYTYINVDSVVLQNLQTNTALFIVGSGSGSDLDIHGGEFQIGTGTFALSDSRGTNATIWYGGASWAGVTIRDCVFTGLYGIYGIRFLYSGTTDQLFYDCDFTTCIVGGNKNHPTTAYGVNGRNAHALIHRSMSMKVVTAAGVPIVGASVKAWDINDTLRVNTTTDGSGNITKQDLPMTRTSWVTDYSSSFDDYGPYKVVISKDGYRDHVMYINPDTKLNIVLGLEALNPDGELTVVAEDNEELMAIMENDEELTVVFDEV